MTTPTAKPLSHPRLNISGNAMVPTAAQAAILEPLTAPKMHGVPTVAMAGPHNVYEQSLPTIDDAQRHGLA